MKKYLLTLLILLAGASLFAQDKKESKTEKKAAVEKSVAALNDAIFIHKDSVVLQKLLDENVTYGHSSGKIETKAVMIHNAVSNTMVYNGFVADSNTIVLHGNTAIVRHILKAKTVDKGVAGVLYLGILQVWVMDKKTNEWTLVTRQAVKLG